MTGEGFRRTPHLTGCGALLMLDVVVAALLWQCGLRLAGSEATLAEAPWMLAHLGTYLLALHALGIYRREALLDGRRTAGRAVAAAVSAGLAAYGAGFLLPAGWRSPDAAAALLGAVASTAASGVLSRRAILALRRRGVFGRCVMIVGAGRRAWEVAWLLRMEAGYLATDFVFVDDPALGRRDKRIDRNPGYRIHGTEAGLLAVARGVGAEVIVVAPEERRGMALEPLLACRVAGFRLMEPLQLLEREIGRLDLKRMETGFLLYSEGFGAGGLERGVKRGLDAALSALFLLGTLPTLGAAMLALWLEDAGPVLLREARVTRGGGAFGHLRLRDRALRPGGEGEGEECGVGALVRRLRLDELPQLLHVLRGQMSFVGPHPVAPEAEARLAAALPLFGRRHVVRPGLTGWGQVNCPEPGTVNEHRSRLSYDLYYVKNFSLGLDLWCLLRALGGRGERAGGGEALASPTWPGP